MVALRLMSWNVQNLFVPGSGGGPRTESEFDAKVAALAAIINRFHPDVLALQEVGTEAALARLQSSLRPTLSHRLLGLPDARHPGGAPLTPHPLMGQPVASRLPVGRGGQRMLSRKTRWKIPARPSFLPVSADIASPSR